MSLGGAWAAAAAIFDMMRQVDGIDAVCVILILLLPPRGMSYFHCIQQ